MIQQTTFCSDNLPTERSAPALGVLIAAQVLGQLLRPGELAQARRPADFWLWHGYLARGKISLLTSQPTTGQNTASPAAGPRPPRPAPAPEVSVEEQRRRTRRWPS
jgi:hypothetical protein